MRQKWEDAIFLWGQERSEGEGGHDIEEDVEKWAQSSRESSQRRWPKNSHKTKSFCWGAWPRSHTRTNRALLLFTSAAAAAACSFHFFILFGGGGGGGRGVKGGRQASHLSSDACSCRSRQATLPPSLCFLPSVPSLPLTFTRPLPLPTGSLLWRQAWMSVAIAVAAATVRPAQS